MKKRMIVLAAAALCLLSGCAGTQVWETVDDVLNAQAEPAFAGACSIRYAQPEQAGEYEIESRILAVDDADSAAHLLTGKTLEQLHGVETTRFGLPEHRFVWCSGEDVCRADIIMDLDYCYALIFRCPEAVSGQYDTTADALFASIRLDYDEGF